MTTSHDHPATALAEELSARDFEQVVLCREPSVGLESVIAIHNTALGPSLGGVRMCEYPSYGAAVADAMNLAEAMTYKSALAGLNLGGGKSVINARPTAENREQILKAHANYVAALGGRDIPGIDMGTTVADLELIGQYVPVTSSQSGDPSLYTARGVVRSIEAALPYAGLGNGFAGVRVAVQGLGGVGMHVTRILTELGAEVTVADLDQDRVARATDQGAHAVGVEDILTIPTDVLCPCAGGGVIDKDVLAKIDARLLAGAANNVLADKSLAGDLAARGIVHVPDFVANAGGIICVDAEVRGDDSGIDAKIKDIGSTVATILDRADSSGRSVVEVALDLARARVAAREADRPSFPELAARRTEPAA
jgi:leucine dehydrogenase